MTGRYFLRSAEQPAAVQTLRIGCTGLLVILSAVILASLVVRALQGGTVFAFALVLWGAVFLASSYWLVTLFKGRNPG
jgi:hypothetical protein